MKTRHSTILAGKILLLLAILFLGGLALSGCVGVSTVPRGWSGGAIADGTLYIGSMEGKLVAVDVSDGSRLWAAPLEASAPASGLFGRAPTVVAIYGTPAVAGDLVYVGGYNGKIYAISSSTRLSKAKNLNETDRQPIVGGPAVAGDNVYIGSADGWVYALGAVSLDEQWKFETGNKIWSTPAVSGDTLFIGSFDKKLYALGATDGIPKWEKPFETEGAIVSTPVVDNNTVYFGSFDRYLYAVDATDGRLKWKFLAGNWFWAKPVIYDGAVYAASLDGKVYVLAGKSGDKLVEPLDLGSPVSSSLVLAGNSVIVATEEGGVYAIDTNNNQSRQLANLGEKVYASLVTSQGIVYVHTAKDVLYAVDARSGAIRSFTLSSK